MDPNITQEIVSTLATLASTAALAFLEIARRRIAAWAAQRTLTGAVERAAGLALEIERSGRGEAALSEAVNYVHAAVPDALKALGAGAHIDRMVQGQMGVLRARGGA